MRKTTTSKQNNKVITSYTPLNVPVLSLFKKSCWACKVKYLISHFHILAQWFIEMRQISGGLLSIGAKPLVSHNG